MYALPLSFLISALAGAVSLALLAGGIALLAFSLRGEIAAAWGWIGGAMLLWALLGKYAVLAAFARDNAAPVPMRGGSGKKIQAPDRSVIHVEFDGPADAPVIVLTQGWGLDLRAWQAVRRRLAGRYRLVLWDLPGLGRSRPPADGTYSVVRLAEDLRRVIDEADPGPVTLAGHGIGAMMILSLCRLHPDLLRRRVRGVVIMNATHAPPLVDGAGAGLLRALRWPLLEPLLLATVLLWPLAWLAGLLGYTSGLTHLAVRLCLFGADARREQIDLVARCGLANKPSTLAKGVLAMLRYDESKTPSRIPVTARVLGSSGDRLVRPDVLERLAALIPGADLLVIPGAGHHVPLEAAGEVADAIARMADKADKAVPPVAARPIPPTTE